MVWPLVDIMMSAANGFGVEEWRPLQWVALVNVALFTLDGLEATKGGVSLRCVVIAQLDAIYHAISLVST